MALLFQLVEQAKRLGMNEDIMAERIKVLLFKFFTILYQVYIYNYGVCFFQLLSWNSAYQMLNGY